MPNTAARSYLQPITIFSLLTSAKLLSYSYKNNLINKVQFTSTHEQDTAKKTSQIFISNPQKKNTVQTYT